MQCLYTSSHSNLSPSHLLMAGVMITASETLCSLAPSCDGTVQRPTNLSPSHLSMAVPVMGLSRDQLQHPSFSPAKASLTLSLPLPPPSHASSVSIHSVSRCQTSSPIPKLQLSLNAEHGVHPCHYTRSFQIDLGYLQALCVT